MTVITHLAFTSSGRMPPSSLISLFPLENEQAEEGFDLAVYLWIDEFVYDPEKMATLLHHLQPDGPDPEVATLDEAVALLKALGWWEKASDLDREILEGLLADDLRPEAIGEHWQANRAWYAAVGEEGDAA